MIAIELIIVSIIIGKIYEIEPVNQYSWWLIIGLILITLILELFIRSFDKSIAMSEQNQKENVPSRDIYGRLISNDIYEQPQYQQNLKNRNKPEEK